jgi:CRP/FNR family transcriptional regulator, cyclic AMP receptor protein
MAKQKHSFNPMTFLSTVGAGRKMMSFRQGETIYAQGEVSDALFVIQNGTVRVSVEVRKGKEVTLDILSDEQFVGEESIADQPLRTASARAITECRLLRIDNTAMLRGLTRQVRLANTFWAYVLAKNLRYQQDLVDHRYNFSEKRLARVLLQLAHVDEHGMPGLVPPIKQETLAEMVGTTRSRISLFLNRFKKSRFIDYDNRGGVLRVHRTLVAYRDQ